MKKKRQPTKLERRVQGIAHRRAARQLMRVPWSQFRNACEKFVRWEALALWVTAIVEAEDGAPSWLVATLKERCPGFPGETAIQRESRLLGFRFHAWIHDQFFWRARQEGWFDALTFYGVRDPRSQSTWAYWEHCEQEWQQKRPSTYPSFEKWLRLARQYAKPSEASGADLRDAVKAYVDWKAFSCWFDSLTKTKRGLPGHVAAELERRCPGFLNLSGFRSRQGLRARITNGPQVMHWVEDHLFASARKQGRLGLIRQQARRHPLCDRIAQYCKLWATSLPKNPAAAYGSFKQWRRAAENHTNE